jgi:CheY-like chemotaxis protein
MARIKLFHSSFIDIYHDPKASYLYVDWRGYQSVESAREGCERILDLMVQMNIDSVLNDNTHVIGSWRGAIEWEVNDWFPRMQRAGLRRFAWAVSPSKPSQVSTDMTVDLIDAEAFGVKIFHNKMEAITWLNQESSESNAAQKHRPRVLVIEDNHDFSELFHSMLHIMGCSPEIAGTAAEGLVMARQIVPEIIFCDIGLPGDMDGYEFADAVRSDKLLWNIPLVAVSGYDSEQHKVRARDAGFDRVFLKPLKFADVTEALASFAHGRPLDRRVRDRVGEQVMARRHYDSR